MADKNPLLSLQALSRAIPAMSRQAMDVTMREAEAQGKRTTAFHDRTGRLRASIRAGILEETPTHVDGALTAGSQDASPGRGPDWEVPSYTYAPYIELGTSRHPPMPFIRPTMVTIGAQNILGKAVRDQWRRWRP